jgi:hypothetical protein
MECGRRHSRWAATLAVWILVGQSGRILALDQTLQAMKSRISSTSMAERPQLCIDISERQLEIATQFYVAGETEKAQAALADVAAFSELARDYAIQSHRKQKQSEIAIRKMARKLEDLKHTVVQEDQKEIQETINRLQTLRDDLLGSMFSQGGKK